MSFDHDTRNGIFLDAGRFKTQQLGPALPHACDMVPKTVPKTPNTERLIPVNWRNLSVQPMQLHSLVSRTTLATLILLLTGSMIASASTFIPQPEPATGWQSKEAVFANQFMAVTAHPLATEAARNVLKSGGTAVDVPSPCGYS